LVTFTAPLAVDTVRVPFSIARRIVSMFRLKHQRRIHQIILLFLAGAQCNSVELCDVIQCSILEHTGYSENMEVNA
jgi:hypothetical protein